MTDEPEKVWISFDETLKPTDPPDYWPKGWPAVFRQPRDSGVLYVRADPVEELRAKSEAFDRIAQAYIEACAAADGPGYTSTTCPLTTGRRHDPHSTTANIRPHPRMGNHGRSEALGAAEDRLPHRIRKTVAL